ncbi:centrosomal protein of 131 kDa-like [Homarus americanus]|uniref:centrosomal protein of 131 kDa-like n=1 Tax=Homarus americanus TaxID=6706 RepID=UPI001C48619A|nr:centrosomal protein of 131 kDa-like [Homarus americanus]XP_042234112.1 centrosomal protein of 131 kDa-like [Homarus americanus]XP_042234114.1 centrosomal protein of 131 kDa-like [Homarus americanus]XP_042234115.1 centrosomal protein of 131 kDa-like [Homarus americanus]
MLEERPNIRRRVGSARSGLSRVGSARPSSGRVSSARPSSDTRRPKLHTGRPSSAPAPSRPSSAPPPGRTGPYPVNRTCVGSSSIKSHDVSHLNLKVEGKSIRSVAYTPRRHQPVSRGSLRVISSHGYSAGGKRKQFFSSHKSGSLEKHELGSDSESSGMGFGSTYTLPLPVNQPIIYGSALSFEHPYADKTGVGYDATLERDEERSYIENKLGSTYTLKNTVSVTSGEEFEFPDRPVRRSLEAGAERSDNLYHLHNSSYFNQATVDQRNFSSDRTAVSDIQREFNDSAYNRRSQLLSSRCGDVRIKGNSSHDVHHNGVSLLKRDTDTTSNDGSECTVMSLGRKIQIMASAQPSRQLDHDNKDENWDTEWKQLLKQNHELLLRLSSREDLRSPDNTPGYDYEKTVLVHDSGVQTSFIKDADEKGSLDCTAGVKSPEPVIYSEYDGGDERLHFHMEDKNPDDNERRESYTNSESPECVLEDIIEESSLSDKSTPRRLVNNSDAMEETHKNPNGDPNPNENLVQSSPEDVSESREIPQSESSEYVSKTSVESPENPPLTLFSSSANISCATDLPTYRTGSAITYVVRSRFSRERMKPQSSKDLLEALQMIEDEEKKDSESHETKDSPAIKLDGGTREEPSVFVLGDGVSMSHSYESTAYEVDSGAKPSSSVHRTVGSKSLDLKKSSVSLMSNECEATLPVLQVLVEKVFLFTQDLAERWKQGNADDCRDDLLYQLAEAERLLEHICIQEGRKEDPKKCPDLHTKCEEKIRKKQEESEARIQKNIELIRKLMDDKKLLTEQCERMHRTERLAEKKHADKIKLLEERHSQEMKNSRERVLASEQEKREKWTQQKTKVIKETTYRGLETKMKDLSAKHRDEVSQLKAQHWEAMKETEEKFVSQLRAQEDELKKKYEQEKEEACKREREREQQRLEVELRQSEQLALSRMETVRKQHERDLKSLIEEHHRTQERIRSENEAASRDATKEKERLKDEYENKIRLLIRSHEDDTAVLRQKDEKSRSEWREQFLKEHNEARLQAERELRERLKRQRDKEIERAIKEIQLETSTREEQDHRAFEMKIKNLRERYENELNELEASERGARSRYLEMKSILAQKEEEIVYFRARLHTQDLELCELQHMFRPPDD